MFATTIALLLTSHVDFLSSKDDVRICAAGFDLLADRTAAKGADEVNVLVLREFAKMFAERLDELGGRDLGQHCKQPRPGGLRRTGPTYREGTWRHRRSMQKGHDGSGRPVLSPWPA